jgi:alkaline phosphatase
MGEPSAGVASDGTARDDAGMSRRPPRLTLLALGLAAASACQDIRHGRPSDARTDTPVNTPDAAPDATPRAPDARRPDAPPTLPPDPHRPDASATLDASQGDAAPARADARLRPDDANPETADATLAPTDGGADARPPDALPRADATRPADATPADAFVLRDLGPPPPPPFDAFAGDLLGEPRVPAQGPPRAVILMIGDGMGPAHIEAARDFAGHPLNLESRLPFHGLLITSSLDGVTDSAAAATTLGSGVPTDNHFVGLDGEGVRVTVGVELAHALGARAGLVTTAALPHATPAGFAAHARNRFDYLHIAESMVRVQPEVMLGGGRLYFWPRGPESRRADSGLLQPLIDVGYTVVTDAAGLQAAQPDARGRLLGAFAADHLAYVLDRPENTPEPTLAQMTSKALELLSPAPGGFFLMVEGAKIDLAGHANQLQRVVPEVLAFDEAVGVVLDWAAGRENTTILVTADHETGELSVTEDRGPGVLPGVRWQRGNHSNRPVDVYAHGEAARPLNNAVLPNRWVHAVLRAGLSGEAVRPPPAYLIPDGRFDDLLLVGRQRRDTDFGVGFNAVSALYAAADPLGLELGVEGLFERGRNGVVIFLDTDFGAGTGFTGPATPLTDLSGRGDALITGLGWDASAIAGLGFDRALVAFGGTDVPRDGRSADAGLRGLAPPENFTPYSVPVVFGEALRPDGAARVVVPGQGLETNLRWRDLYAGGAFPRGARVAVFVTLADDVGGVVSNQCLPALPPGAPDPVAGNPLVVPGVYVLNLDTDLDATPDPEPTIELVSALPGVMP